MYRLVIIAVLLAVVSSALPAAGQDDSRSSIELLLGYGGGTSGGSFVVSLRGLFVPRYRDHSFWLIAGQIGLRVRR